MSAVDVLADGRMRFDGEGDFHALESAREWCRKNGVSYGPLQCGDPVGLMVGDYDISKWRNLSAKDRAELDGVLTGDERNGPVYIQMTPAALARCSGEGA